DGGAGRITDARVMVNYYMPPMPRMAPMNYTTRAKWKGESYNATMRFIMAGPWIIRVLATHEGKRAVAKFNVDAQQDECAAIPAEGEGEGAFEVIDKR
ncbi:MAG: FixH family protein, partial [Thermodesulfobacteriota bacterium]